MMLQGKEVITNPDFSSFPEGKLSRFWLDIVANGIGQDIHIPVMVARGKRRGPTLGITAVVHGNELNGLSVVQRLMHEINLEELCGTIVGVPVMNVPSILKHQRRFTDGEDLNRIFPGTADGDESSVYAYRLMDRVINKLDYLIDLHTASFGRVNSYYIRADLSNETTRRMALLQNAEIILNSAGKDGTLRSAAMENGVKSITVEVGDPNKFQKGMIRSGLAGIYNVLVDIDMLSGEIDLSELSSVICTESEWMYTDRGGILEVKPNVGEFVYKGQVVAHVRNIFGEMIKEYVSPHDGIVIGKHVHPVNQTGGRILHLGKVQSAVE